VCVVLCRHGKYEYRAGTTSIIDESVKQVRDEDDDWLIGAETVTTTPMQV